MANFKIVWEIELEAQTPLEAAKTAQEWIKEPLNNWQFYVQNEETKEISSVDLEEVDENAVFPVKSYHPLIKEQK
jgi:hypothetical protein